MGQSLAVVLIRGVQINNENLFSPVSRWLTFFLFRIWVVASGKFWTWIYLLSKLPNQPTQVIIKNKHSRTKHNAKNNLPCVKKLCVTTRLIGTWPCFRQIMSTESKSMRDLDSPIISPPQRDETKLQTGHITVKESRTTRGTETSMPKNGILERLVYDYLSYAWDV